MTSPSEPGAGETRITLDGGKYTFRISHFGEVICDRFDIGRWVIFDRGDKALMSLIHRVVDLERALADSRAASAALAELRLATKLANLTAVYGHPPQGTP